MKVSRFIFAAICGLIVAASCDKVENDQKGNEFVFNLIPTVETTKTAMNAAGTDVVWQGTEVMSTYLNGSSLQSTISTTNTFSAKVNNSGSYAISAGVYKVQGFEPSSAFIGFVRNTSSDAVQVYKLKFPSTQNPTTTSFDPSADILIGKLQDVTVTSSEVTAGKKDVNFYFGRIGAITRISLNRNSSTSISAGEKVKRVEIEFPDAVKVAGNFCFDAFQNKFVSTSNTSDNTAISDLRDIFYENATNKLTIEYPLSNRPTIENLDVWAVVPPVTVNAGETINFTIYTDTHTIVKAATPTQAISFSNQQLNTLSLNLASAEVGAAEVVKSDTYSLVTSASDITAGEYIIAAAHKDATETFLYLPNIESSSSNPSICSISEHEGATISSDYSTVTLTSEVKDMTWTFVSVSGGVNILSSANNSLGLGTTNSTGTNIRVSSSYKATIWTFQENTNFNWLIYNNNSTKMYLAVYSSSMLRNYSNQSSNQNGKFYIFKKQDSTPTISVSNSSVQVASVSDVYDMSVSLSNSTSAVSVDCDGVVVTEAEISGTTCTFVVSDNKSLESVSGWLKFSSAGAADVQVPVTQSAAEFVVSKTSVQLGNGEESEETFTVTSDFAGTISYADNDLFMTDKNTFSAGTTTITVVSLTENSNANEVDLGTITVVCDGFDASTAKSVAVSQQGTSGPSVLKSISEYADGTYFIVDTFDDKYYAMTGEISNKTIASTDITSAVTAYSDGSISIDESNSLITDNMKYTLSKTGDAFFLTSNGGTEIHLLAKGNNLGTTTTIDWTGFEASAESNYRFSLTATGSNSKGSATDNCLLLQGINYQNSEFVSTLVFKGYVQSNRGSIATGKQASYASGYMYFVPVR